MLKEFIMTKILGYKKVPKILLEIDENHPKFNKLFKLINEYTLKPDDLIKRKRVWDAIFEIEPKFRSIKAVYNTVLFQKQTSTSLIKVFEITHKRKDDFDRHWGDGHKYVKET